MRSRSRPVALVAVLAASLPLAACGSDARQATVESTAAADCRPVVMQTIASVADRAYAEVASGRLIGVSRIEVQRDTALLTAVAADDSVAATAAGQRLLARTEIAFLQIRRAGRLVVNLGGAPAIARAAGVLRVSGKRIARFVLAVQGDSGYAAVVHGLTGAGVLVRRGPVQLAATLPSAPRSLPASGQVSFGHVSYGVSSFAADAYPAGREHVYLLAGPKLFDACAATPAQTVANVLGPLAMRVYAHETTSHSEQTAVAYIARSPAFTAAVAAGNSAGVRAAIITFFRSHRHIVRVRAVRGARLVDDVGGPYVLAPVAGTLRQDGRIIGRFVAAIQDDAGYVALTHIYTGAQVILRAGDSEVPSSTLQPGPPTIPTLGPVTYRGRVYEAYSFDGQRFPTGQLRISVLVPRSS